jgi:uncharacterized protein (DUF1697 family)
MGTYISILRGINVSGHNLIKMPELKNLFENLGFKEVQTYIQSGNIVYQSVDNLAINELSIKIEKEIENVYGMKVPVITRAPEEIHAVLDANPFRNPDGSANENIYITFLEDIPSRDTVLKINPLAYLPDRFVISGREIYINCSAGYGTTKLSNTFFENKLKVRATTRNWKTVNMLIELAR